MGHAVLHFGWATRRWKTSAKLGTNNAHVQRWLEYVTAFDYDSLGLSKGGTTGNASFLPRLPQPVTEYDRSGCGRLMPVDYEVIYPIRACGRRIRSSLIPGVGLRRLVPRHDSAVLGGLPFAHSDFSD